MKKVMLALVCCAGFSLSSVQAAAPNINVGSLFDFINSDKGTFLKRVRNSGDATAFVRVEISEIVYDADRKPVEQPVENTRLGEDKDGLVASPARLIIPANSQQSARLLYSGDRTHEKYYRVRFVPAMPDKSDDFSLSTEERDQYKKEMSAGVSIMTGYGTIVVVHPSKAHFATDIKEGADGYTVSNNGNSTIVLDGFKACGAKGKDCQPGRQIHLLPQSSQTFSKSEQHTYEFKLIEGNQEEPVRLGFK